LATCDSKGVIYVWVKYEGRWSIELINDRGICVSDFAWSHDGRMAVICYQDGFVLVGSVTGQRFWSHLYDLPTYSITTATWTPNDLHLILGMSNGALMVVDENGLILSKHNLKNDNISNLAYNCPKFTIGFLNDGANNNGNVNKNSATATTAAAAASSSRNLSNLNNSSQLSSSITNINNLNNNRLNRLSNHLQNMSGNSANTNANNYVNTNTNANNDSRINSRVNNNNYMLACSFKSNGLIYLLKTYDDVDPFIIDTKLEGNYQYLKIKILDNKFPQKGSYKVLFFEDQF